MRATCISRIALIFIIIAVSVSALAEVLSPRGSSWGQRLGGVGVGDQRGAGRGLSIFLSSLGFFCPLPFESCQETPCPERAVPGGRAEWLGGWSEVTGYGRHPGRSALGMEPGCIGFPAVWVSVYIPFSSSS